LANSLPFISKFVKISEN